MVEIHQPPNVKVIDEVRVGMSKVGLAMSEAGRPGRRASEREEEIGAKTMNDHPSSYVELVVLSEEEPKPGGGVSFSSLVTIANSRRKFASTWRRPITRSRLRRL